MTDFHVLPAINGDDFSIVPCTPWMQTLGGGAMDLINPNPAAVDFRQLSHVLARVPRFGGHTERGLLSVAQHCLAGAEVLLRDTGRRDAAAAFLLHDAHEAYIGDIPTPVRDALMVHAQIESSDLAAGDTVKRAVAALKHTLDGAIYLAAGITYPLPADVERLVREYDLRMLVTEARQRLAPPPYPWTERAEPLSGVDLSPYSVDTVAALWYAAARELLDV